MPFSRQTILFTPGPLTTRSSVRDAMRRDFGSREPAFIALTARVRSDLQALADAPGAMSVVPLQGSGTYAVEAMLGTLVRPGERVLIASNGAYGERMHTIATRLRIDAAILRRPVTSPLSPVEIDEALKRDPDIAYIAIVHGETTTGLVNPLAEISAVVHRHGRALLVDAMSTFGGWPLSLREIPVAALAASSNKCLEGVPGISFVITHRDLLAARRGVSPSVCLDLAEQWAALEENGQWRFTPPTHVVAALARALADLADEGGPRARHERYTRNRQRLVAGMRELGFETLLADHLQGPAIVTFKERPDLPFARLYEELAERGFILYPGKLTEEPTFRIGCIGAIESVEIDAMLAALARHAERQADQS